jgi:uncharacterized protein (DUF362 family)
VVIVRDEKVQGDDNKVDPTVLKKMLEETVKAVTGESSGAAAWKKLVKPDDVVGLTPTAHLIKTHSELVEAVTDAIVEAGVPADRIQNVQMKKDLAAKCTALIPLPALKAHFLTGIGTVLKNFISLGEKKASTYHNPNSGALASIWLEPGLKGKTRIVIVDALRPLFAQGPQVTPQYQWNYNGLMASTDPVALEVTALQIIMAKRKAFKGEAWELNPPALCVAAADKEYKLGTSDPAKITLKIIGWEKDLLIQA